MKASWSSHLGWVAFGVAAAVSTMHAQYNTPPILVGASSIDGQQVGVCFSEETERSSL